MTASSAPNLSSAKVRRLLAAVGSAPGSAEEVPEVTAYDWRDPHYFNEDQRNRLAAVMTQVAALMSDRFAHFYNSEFNVKAVSITAHFAEDLARQIEPDQGFSLPFGPDSDHPCGFLIVGTEAALDWATRLLGDSEANNDPDRVMSALEESLLSDLLTAVARTFLDPLGTNPSLEPTGHLGKGCPAVSYEPTEEICQIVFQIQKADAAETAEVSFVLPCRVLAPSVGKALSAEAKPPQEQLARLLMEHVQQMSVAVTVRLAATRLSFEEVLDLSPDDVLLIDKPMEEPVDVMIEGQTVFRGRPAQSNGQYAVFVTECAADPTSKTAKNAAAN